MRAKQNFVVWILTLGILALPGCSWMPFIGGEPQIKLDMKADPMTNSCGRERGAPLTFRVLQVKNAQLLSGVALSQVWGNEEAVFGDALVSKNEDVIEPGGVLKASIPRDPEAESAILIGNFCQVSGSCWYVVKHFKGSGGVSMHLEVGEGCLTDTRP